MKTESLLIGLFAGLLSTNIYALGEATQTPVWAEEITPLDSHWGGSNANNLPNHPEYGRLAFMNDTSQTEANGLYVVNPHGPTEHSNAVWSKVAVDLGLFNVRDYGAWGNGFTLDDSEAVQAAIDAASENGGGIVYFPPGTYKIDAGITIPRIANQSITLQGAGIHATTITAKTDLDSEIPMIQFSGTDHAEGFQLRDMRIDREDNPGLVFYHAGASAQGSSRFRYSRIENVWFTAPALTTHDVVVIEGAFNSDLENVTISGGNSALVLRDSSHCRLRNIHQTAVATPGNTSVNAVRLVSGGSHHLSQIRADNVTGSVLSLEASPLGILGTLFIEGVFNEGKDALAVVNTISSGAFGVEDVQIVGLNVATPCQVGLSQCEDAAEAAYGVYIDDHVRNFHVRGNRMSSWGDRLGYPIYVEAGAAYVTFDEIRFSGPPDSLNLDDWIFTEPGATAVSAEFWMPADERPRKWRKEVGHVVSFERLNASSAAIFTEAQNTLRAPCTPTYDGPIQAIHQNGNSALPDYFTDEPTGTIITILGAEGTGCNPSNLESGTGNVRLTEGIWAANPGEVIQLVWDGQVWREFNRSST